jgi:hypothetical protein
MPHNKEMEPTAHNDAPRLISKPLAGATMIRTR